MFGESVFQQTVGIPMSTNCDTILSNVIRKKQTSCWSF